MWQDAYARGEARVSSSEAMVKGRRLLWVAVMLIGVAAALAFQSQSPVSAQARAQAARDRHVVVISIDGFPAFSLERSAAGGADAAEARARGRGRGGDDSGEPDGHLAESHLDGHRRPSRASHRALQRLGGARRRGRASPHRGARAEDRAGEGDDGVRPRASGGADHGGSGLGGDRECADDHVCVHRVFESRRRDREGDDRRRA